MRRCDTRAVPKLLRSQRAIKVIIFLKSDAKDLFYILVVRFGLSKVHDFGLDLTVTVQHRM